MLYCRDRKLITILSYNNFISRIEDGLWLGHSDWPRTQLAIHPILASNLRLSTSASQPLGLQAHALPLYPISKYTFYRILKRTVHQGSVEIPQCVPAYCPDVSQPCSGRRWRGVSSLTESSAHLLQVFLLHQIVKLLFFTLQIVYVMILKVQEWQR